MSRTEEAEILDERPKLRLADPNTALGMLQRGRPAGYLHAIEMAPKKIWPMLIECITNDPVFRRDFEGGILQQLELYKRRERGFGLLVAHV